MPKKKHGFFGRIGLHKFAKIKNDAHWAFQWWMLKPNLLVFMIQLKIWVETIIMVIVCVRM